MPCHPPAHNQKRAQTQSTRHLGKAVHVWARQYTSGHGSARATPQPPAPPHPHTHTFTLVHTPHLCDAAHAPRLDLLRQLLLAAQPRVPKQARGVGRAAAAPAMRVAHLRGKRNERRQPHAPPARRLGVDGKRATPGVPCDHA
eukprot:364767-Chlamydomonas_euryale.AAC.1